MVPGYVASLENVVRIITSFHMTVGLERVGKVMLVIMNEAGPIIALRRLHCS